MILQKHKIVFGGALGAGKTKAIQSLSELSILSVDAVHTSSDLESKPESRVDIDYAEIELDDGIIVGLYATPTEHLDSIGAKLCKDAIGAVILIDHSLKTSLDDLERYLDAFHKHLANIAIGVTHVDQDPQQLLKKYRNWVRMRNQTIPIFAIDTRKKEDVLMMIEVLIARAEQD